MGEKTKLTVLGSGTCVPDGQRSSSGYFLETSDARVMLDCGAGTLHALGRYGIPWERMTHLFISHFHVDHVGEVASLMFAFRYAMKNNRDEPLTLVGPRGLDRVIEGLESSFGTKLFQPAFPVQLNLLDPGDRIELGPRSTLAVAKTPHNGESLAVRIESGDRTICYTGDTGYDEELERFFRSADLLVSECSFLKQRPGIFHLSIEEAARLASGAQVSRLLLSHFYFDARSVDLVQEVKQFFGGQVMVGADGLAVEL